MKPPLTIAPPREAIERALESWQWLPVARKDPIVVTTFGDIFFAPTMKLQPDLQVVWNLHIILTRVPRWSGSCSS